MIHDDASIVDSTGRFVAANGKQLAEQPVQRIIFGHWGTEAREDVVVCRVSESVTEIHCHGGEHAVGRIMEDLASTGCRVISWQDAQREQLGWLDTELDAALSRALTVKTADHLLAQRNGILRDCLTLLRQQIAELAGDAEVPAITANRTVLDQLDELLAWSAFARHLTEPWKIVLAGLPNVGKSSLINALVGYSRAIVSPVPGTTRDLVTAETAFAGWPVQLIDTAGLRDSSDEVESIGVGYARQELQRADCRLILLDVSQPIAEEERQLIDSFEKRLVVAHKCDLLKSRANELPPDCIFVSSTERIGLKELMSRIVAEILPELPNTKIPLPISNAVVELLESVKSSVTALDLAEAVRQLDRSLS